MENDMHSNSMSTSALDFYSTSQKKQKKSVNFYVEKV